MPQFLVKHTCVFTGLTVILLLRYDCSGFQADQCSLKQFTACCRQLIMQAAAGFFGIHRYFCLQQHITCIQTNIHQHGCHTCHFLAVNDRPLDRCRTAELRKQGCMDIHTAQSRNIQDFFWQDLSKCNNNNHIRCHISQCLNKFRILLDADRLINRKIMGQSTFLDR